MSSWDPIEALGRHQQREVRLAEEVGRLQGLIREARAHLAERDWIGADAVLEGAEPAKPPEKEPPCRAR